MKRTFEDGLSLLAGIGVGSALMYLLDPEAGAQRRQKIADTTRGAVGQAGEYFGDAGDYLSDAGQQFAQQARGFVSRLGDNLSDQSEDAADTVSDYRKRITEAFSGPARDYTPYLQDLQSRLQKKLGRGMKQARKTIKRNASSSNTSDYIAPAVGYTAGGIALLALGAGMAYLFDPDRGRARRAYLMDKTTSIARDAGGVMRKTGKHLSNKMYGSAMEATRPIRQWRNRGQEEEGPNCPDVAGGTTPGSEPNTF
jgi:gas vesicle protein